MPRVLKAGSGGVGEGLRLTITPTPPFLDGKWWSHRPWGCAGYSQHEGSTVGTIHCPEERYRLVRLKAVELQWN